MSQLSRPRVLWFGPKPTPSDSSEFDHRDLSLEYPNDTSWKDLLPTTRGIILKDNAVKPGAITKYLETISREAIDHGTLLYIIADDDRSFNAIRDTIKRQHLLPFIDRKIIELKTAPPAHEVAQSILLHNPGPSLNPLLNIGPIGDTIKLDEAAQLFLKRAFWDCKSVAISPLPGGRSAKAFSVYAEYFASTVGPWPLPFFVKIDTTLKTEKEWNNYKQYVFHYVPFNLRPNLDEKRCIVGFDRGMLVGNFVEYSEALFDVARRGGAEEAIYSLFDHALRGWRLQADPARQNHPLWIDFIKNKGLFDPSRISSRRFDQAKTLGATKSPQELRDILLGLPLGNYLEVPIHGDLHAFNVRVRRTDAILIDFASTRSGPFVADPASLEVSIAFGVARGEKHDQNNHRWAAAIDNLYAKSCIEQPPPLARAPRPHEWLWTCLRQIRRFVLDGQMNKYDYGLALSVYLLRRSMYAADEDVEATVDDFRRAYGYRVAERIILDIAQLLTPPVSRSTP